jgi:hypothetical protein
MNGRIVEQKNTFCNLPFIAPESRMMRMQIHLVVSMVVDIWNDSACLTPHLYHNNHLHIRIPVTFQKSDSPKK